MTNYIPEPQDNEKNYVPENPVWTFFGLNHKQMVFRILGSAAALSLAIGFLFERLVLGLIICILFLAAACLYYLRNREKIIKDYQAVKIGKIPLRPLQSIDFSLKESLIIVVLMIATLIFLFYFAEPILEFFGK